MIPGGCRISRRRFLQAAGSAAGALAASSLFPPAPRAAAGKTVDVAVSSAASPAERARKAVSLVGGMPAFVSRGDVVVLKPNIGWDRTPEQAATTDPEFVVAVAEMCLSAGARSVRIFDRTCNDARRCYVSSGIQDAVERFARKNRVEDALRIYHVEDRKFVRTSIPNALSIREWDLYRDALEADRIVNLPIAKHHSLSGITLGLKNMMGIMGGNRGQIHYRLPECLVDIHRRVPVALTVIDAGRVLLRNGPSGGSLADVKFFGKAFASRDGIAADVIAAEKIFRLAPRDVGHIGKAMESGLGVASRAQIRVVEG
ncbi:MAG: DUF362 domain-containing protein [Actinomycetota bacterium]